MSNIGFAGKLYDVFVREPVSFWTGKDAKEVRPIDALPLYVGAALWPLAVIGIAGCDETGDQEYGCDEGETRSSYSGPNETKNTGICQDQIEECAGGVWQVVQEEVCPSQEIYTNEIDDNCNGYVDEIEVHGEAVYESTYDCDLAPD
ncbi:MAG: hypothetical protein JXA24_00575 [Proteobacteria bacterium]|nr:hypothetical protein [Pseudomonadota bacterium]